MSGALAEDTHPEAERARLDALRAKGPAWRYGDEVAEHWLVLRREPDER